MNLVLTEAGSVTPAGMMCVCSFVFPWAELGGPVWGICTVQKAEGHSPALGNPTGPSPHSTSRPGFLEHFQKSMNPRSVQGALVPFLIVQPGAPQDF